MKGIDTGFQDVREPDEAKALFEFLDMVDGQNFIRECKAQIHRLCPVPEGAHILDVGCGLGHEAQRLAQLAGPQGRVVGIDKSELMIEESRRRAVDRSSPVEFAAMDACRLDFPEHTFDLCRAERVLRYIENPQQVIHEMARVARPEGRIVIFDFDSAGLVVDAPDPVLTRRIGRLLGDAVPHGWIGRQLVRLFKEAGLLDVAAFPQTSFLPFSVYKIVAGGTLEEAVQAGDISSTDVARWWADLEQVNQEDNFFAAFLGFIVSGRKS